MLPAKPRRTRSSTASLALTALLTSATAALSEELRTLSPGGSAQAPGLAESCPTFSWAGVADTEGYEIVVFRVTGDEAPEATPTSSESAFDIALRELLPAGATSWTPDLRDCLQAGASYAWSLRSKSAASETDSDRRSDWVAPAWFEVSPEPSSEEVERALDVLRRYRASRGAEEKGLVAAPSPTPAATKTSASGVDRATKRGAAASAPTLDPNGASLAVSGQLSLTNAGAVFKDDKLFLWDEVVDTGILIGSTALGRDALASNTPGTPFAGSGTGNTALGFQALALNTSGRRNTATGERALRANTTGNYNTASGSLVLVANTEGERNTAAGFGALGANVLGDLNTATGAHALAFNVDGSRNTATGAHALRGGGSMSTATGAYALQQNTGTSNTATGVYSLRSNTTGSRNAAIGYRALIDNTIGIDNTASGTHALEHNTEGSRNVAAGAFALRTNTTGARNVAVGVYSLEGGLEGYNNTGVGYRALRLNESGVVNLALGAGAGYNTTGDYNILIASRGVAGESNVLRIGQAAGSGYETLGKAYIQGIAGQTITGGATVYINATGQLGTTTSSARFKEEIADLDDASTERLLQLRPVSFRYRRDAVSTDVRPLEIGLIAEEVAEVYPELVTFDGYGRPSAVRYHQLPTLLLDRLQEQHRRFAAQERELESARRDAAATRAVLERTRTELADLRAELGLSQLDARPREGRRHRWQRREAAATPPPRTSRRP